MAEIYHQAISTSINHDDDDSMIIIDDIEVYTRYPFPRGTVPRNLRPGDKMSSRNGNISVFGYMDISEELYMLYGYL